MSVRLCFVAQERKRFYVCGPPFSHLTPVHHPQGTTRALKGCPGEMWSHPLFRSPPPESFLTRPDNSCHDFLPALRTQWKPLPRSRGSILLAMRIFVFPSKWCSLVTSLLFGVLSTFVVSFDISHLRSLLR